MSDAQALLIGLGVFAALMALILLRRVLRILARFLLRAGAGAGVLAVLGPLSGGAGIHLGVSLFNVALLGALGAPGLGLLLLLNWLVRQP
jgi:inhibitor of the pro-sigma K processing machinery